ncbi:hypothetical protein [Nocardia nova]|nr:hypothetical protein [Nocardia nova]
MTDFRMHADDTTATTTFDETTFDETTVDETTVDDDLRQEVTV